MRNALVFASLLAVAGLVACGGGTPPAGPISPQSSIPPNSTAPTSGNVQFFVTVPSGVGIASSRRRPAFVAPSGTQSISIATTSVNGVAFNGTPTVIDLATSSDCEPGTNQLLCSITVSGVPVGTIVFTIDTFTSANGSGTPSGEGMIQVTTTAGQTTNVSATLGGTVAKIVNSIGGVAVFGSAGSVPVIVDAMDANGNTIIGNYTNSITLNDTDASGQTSLASAGPFSSSTAAATGAILNYAGGTMTTAASIGAYAPGVAGSNVTPAMFLPNQTLPAVNGASTTFDYSTASSNGYDAAPTSPNPVSTGTYTATVATGQTFNGVSNLIGVSGLPAPTNGSPQSFNNDDNLDDQYVAYFAWNSLGGVSSLGFVGVSDPTDDTQITCSSPYSNQVELPFPASWNVLSGSGPCAYLFQIDGGLVVTETDNYSADGSYNFMENAACCGYYLSFGDQSNGSAYYEDSGDEVVLTIPAPSPGAATVTAVLQPFSGETPGPSPSPAATPTTAPNPWLAIASYGATGVGSGTVPSPLESDTFVGKGGITSLPAQCNIGPSLLGTQPTLSEADETIVFADPISDINALYSTSTINHYYLDGVGEVCNENVATYYYYDDNALDWYGFYGSPADTNIDTYTSTTWAWVTTSTLTATFAHRRDFAQAMLGTSHAFAAASYVLAHSQVRASRSRRHLSSNPRIAQLQVRYKGIR